MISTRSLVASVRRNSQPTPRTFPNHGTFDWLDRIVFFDQAADDHALAVVQHDVGFQLGRLRLGQAGFRIDGAFGNFRLDMQQHASVARDPRRQPQHDADVEELHVLNRAGVGRRADLKAQVLADLQPCFLFVEHQ